MTSKKHKVSRAKMKAGHRYGRLMAVEFVRRNKQGNAIWKWLCNCGNMRDVVASNVERGSTKSCGCLNNEMRPLIGMANATHRMWDSLEYKSWCGIIQRCTNPNNNSFQDYGGRGITVCDRWRYSFDNFFKDMGPRPSPSHSIDRFPNNNGNYEPENCRWATRKEQNRNSRHNRLVVVDGIKVCVAEAAERAGLNYCLVRKRLDRDWPVEIAIKTPSGLLPKRTSFVHASGRR